MNLIFLVLILVNFVVFPILTAILKIYAIHFIVNFIALLYMLDKRKKIRKRYVFIRIRNKYGIPRCTYCPIYKEHNQCINVKFSFLCDKMNNSRFICYIKEN